jgi:acetoin utilization deacetylase AcuC-like enzyme
MVTALVYDERFLSHDPGPNHPEKPQRLTAIVQGLHEAGLWDSLLNVAAPRADEAWVYAVHDPDYVARLRIACKSGIGYIDCMDSAVCPASFEAALAAAGGAVNAVEAVMAGRAHNAFCAVRPPGHHCERDRSMGFCLLNNIAVAAQYLVDHHKLRPAIVDFDVHHANGTQHIFEQRGDVLVASVHEHPSYLYPGTGFDWERGSGEGEGATLNVALPPHSGDDEYKEAFTGQILPAVDAFKPDFLLVSAGFDASGRDPLAHQQVTTEGFAWMTRVLVEAAQRHCGGKLVSMLEGGYHLPSLAEAATAHVRELMAAEPA